VVGDSVGYLMHQVVLSMRRQIEQAMLAHDLTAAQWLPLWKLKRDGPCTSQELARNIDMDAGAMTRLVDRLVAKGLVLRERSLADRRVVRLSLSAEGDAVTARVPQVLAQVNATYLQGVGESEQDTLKRLLRAMLANAPSAVTAGGEEPA
jgi:DNA-binding MarR family transcriptional regulator